MAVYGGIDWAEGHHDIALVDDEGRLLAKRRIGETPAGLGELLAMLAAAGDSTADPIPVAIETPRIVGGCVAGGGSAGLSDQPVGGGPVSGTDLGVGQEERSCGCDGVGQHSANR